MFAQQIDLANEFVLNERRQVIVARAYIALRDQTRLNEERRLRELQSRGLIKQWIAGLGNWLIQAKSA